MAKERLGPLGKLHSKVVETLRELRSAPSIKDLLKFEVRVGGWVVVEGT